MKSLIMLICGLNSFSFAKPVGPILYDPPHLRESDIITPDPVVFRRVIERQTGSSKMICQIRSSHFSATEYEQIIGLIDDAHQFRFGISNIENETKRHLTIFAYNLDRDEVLLQEESDLLRIRLGDQAEYLRGKIAELCN